MASGIKSVKSRRVYGKPLSKLAEDIPLSKDVLRKIGKIIAASIRREAERDAALKMGGGRGNPVGMTPAHQIAKSIRYRVLGDSTLEFYSNHPMIKTFTEGRDPYPMTWLTRNAGVGVVPIITEDGVTIFRTAPLDATSAWIHPGFLKYTFFERGVRKGRLEAMGKLYEMAIRDQIAKTDFLQ
jgi:hypothetical protein